MSILNTIKEEIQKRTSQPEETTVVEQNVDMLPDGMFAECATFFQELNDLSVEGNNPPIGPRAPIAIPLNDDLDDIELSSIEFNIKDNRVMDVPGDAGIHTETSYLAMKTYEEFFKEACEHFESQFQRISESDLKQRAVKLADRQWKEYTDKCYQEGLFGFDKVSLSDDKVPSSVIVNLGPIDDDPKKPMYTTLKILYQVTSKNKILKKQLDSIEILRQHNIFTNIKPAIAKKEECDESKVWVNFIPKKVIVPIDPEDCFAIGLGYAPMDDEGDVRYMIWSCPIKSGKKSVKDIKDDVKEIKADDNFDEIKSKDQTRWLERTSFLKEQAEITKIEKKATLSRFHQESIDFGDTQTEPTAEAPTDGPSVSVDTPPVEEAPAGEVEPAAATETNDVSAQIAEKVNAENIPADTSVEEPAGDTSSEPAITGLDDIDAALNGLGGSEEPTNTSPADVEPTFDGDMGSTDDFDNMTIEDIKASIMEKIESLPIGQLKKFAREGIPAADTSGSIDDGLGNPDTGIDGVDPIDKTGGVTTESYQPTVEDKLYDEADVALRDMLGLFNSNDLKGEDICTKTKAYAKKLNTALTKASSKAKSKEDKKKFDITNQALINVTSDLSSKKDENFGKRCRASMSIFITHAKELAKIIEKEGK